jgi:5-methylcytosine-specific restriction enzyme subunit McrC
MTAPDPVPLAEFKTVRLPRHDLPDELGERIWRDFGKQVLVEFPSPKTGGQWELKNQGWAGYIPLGTDRALVLQPKVSIGNLFRLLEYAYNLKGLRFFDDLISLASLPDAFQRLAVLLAQRTLERARKGLYRTYEARSGRLSFVKGRIDVRSAMSAPWCVGLPCHFEEHTANIEDNQLLAWTLERIARSGICSGKALVTVRAAHRALLGTVDAPPFLARDCIGRTYTRLNDDYSTLHALCRFFLEHTGSSHVAGDRRMVPFVVDMSRLFERFVAQWLRLHLPDHLRLRVQERLKIGPSDEVEFQIDLSIEDKSTGKTLCVLDTKYKNANRVSPEDVAQIVTYAEIKGTQDGVLVFPERADSFLDTVVGSIRVRALAFDISQHPEDAGWGFLKDLLG